MRLLLRAMLLFPRTVRVETRGSVTGWVNAHSIPAKATLLSATRPLSALLHPDKVRNAIPPGPELAKLLARAASPSPNRRNTRPSRFPAATARFTSQIAVTGPRC